jgi:GntP family gluconate:H+ symporter
MPPLAILAGSMALVIGLIAGLRLHAFVALLVGATAVGLATPALSLGEAASNVATEFGVVCGRIGIVIALASVIGLALQQSGAATRISGAFLALTGVRRGYLSLWASGYVLSVPVFFDTVFYLLAPLARAMAGRRDATGEGPVESRARATDPPASGDPPRPSYPLCVMAILAGAAATHVFVPPTPGPLAAAAALGADLGTLIALGLVVALPASLAGVAYARWTARPGGPAGDAIIGDEAGDDPPSPLRLPGLGASLVPIALPVGLISGRTAATAAGLTGPVAAALAFAGDPNVALFLSATLAMRLVVRARGASLRALGDMTERALSSGGGIILITAAGGAYGAMLSKAGIGASLAGLGAASHLPVLWLAYLMASLLKVAQGSSTVAIITGASVLQAGYAGPDGALLPNPAYAVLALGGGSLVGSWMNDSGFWIVGRIGGFSDRDTLRYWTGVAAVVGTAGFVATLVLAAILPLR